MLLKLSNVKNVKEANIEFDGITVIVGENTTGKSTISKSLFSFFASFRNLATDREELLKDHFKAILRQLDFNALSPKQRNEFLDELINYRFNVKKNTIINEEINSSIFNLINKYMKDTKSNADYFESTAAAISKFIETKNEDDLNGDCIKKYLIAEFSDKIYNVKDNNYDSYITVGLHYINSGNKNDINNYKKKNTIFIDGKNNNNCIVKEDEAIRHKVFYFDGLNVDYNLDINDLYTRRIRESYSHKVMFDSEIYFDNKSYNDSVDEIEINKLFESFGNIGKVYVNEDQTGTLYENYDYKVPINSHQISQGVKGLLVFRQFLIKNRLNDEDVLILDEPEVNLHPKWQIEFAKLIVGLQKKYTLTILLCSHSPFFIKAIKVFSKYNDIFDKTKFYLAENLNGYNVINDVTNEVDLVFKSLTEPYLDLMEFEQNG